MKQACLPTQAWRPSPAHTCFAEDSWSELASGTFTATYGFSYLVAVLFMLFFLVLLVFQSAVTKELGIYK